MVCSRALNITLSHRRTPYCNFLINIMSASRNSHEYLILFFIYNNEPSFKYFNRRIPLLLKNFYYHYSYYHYFLIYKSNKKFFIYIHERSEFLAVRKYSIQKFLSFSPLSESATSIHPGSSFIQ